MNYLRGAVVNAISAPYQFYKDVNPSTLTGAIDVIVIQRPTSDGNGTELACSPFHVRFGKWQVLRPAEKKVSVSVNGNPIPYNMKIGDAGEAFFVFETEDDVPDDLITSPILQATTPTSEASAIDAGAQASGKDKRFAADSEQQGGDEEDDEKLGGKHAESNRHEEPVERRFGEPEYLDLDGRSEAQLQQDDATNQHITPKPTHHVPSFLKRSASRTTLNQPSYLDAPREEDDHGNRTPEMVAQDQVVDQALKRRLREEGRVPEVEYHQDVALDMEGYHSGRRRRGADEIVPSSHFKDFKLPPSQIPLDSSTVPVTPADTDLASLNDTSHRSSSPKQFPLFRAVSEPPPDVNAEPTILTIPDHSTSELLDHSHYTHTATQEYMWEWGNFPQPSPMKTTFSKGGRLASPRASSSRLGDRWRSNTKTVQVRNGKLGGMSIPILEDSDEEGEDGVASEEDSRGRTLGDDKHGRSHSLPPQSHAGGSSSLTKRDRRRWKEYEDFDEAEEDEFSRESRLFKDEGGSLRTSRGDPTKFVLSIEGQKVGFQLSLGGTNGVGPESFQQHLIDFDRFLNDDNIIDNPALVIRWVGVDQYITREDSPPLMDALAQWRDTALRRRAAGQFLRPVSPFSEDSQPTSPVSETPSDSLGYSEKTHMRAKSEPPEQGFQDEDDRKPSSENQKSSYSWVPWFRSSKKKEVQRSPLEEAPTQNGSANGVPPASKADTITEAVENIPVHEVNHDVLPSPGAETQPALERKKKFAKTLRLTSDQLKALNLQPGPNTITFSLSATGAVAATARIFVWDHTDLVVVSDIDGTITKSDGLGHVFAMIGRDWTHLGVAKLYTDVTRNGYKVMYLTSRAIGQADATRGYLKGIKQNDYQLPEGPVIMSPDRLMASLHREVVLRKPEVFKMACLRDIQRLFGEHCKYPFYAGFGNRITDALSYRTVNIPSARIFTIDSAGEVKMELLELAGYKSSYIHMTDLVDQMFPPIHKKWTPEYTDFNYWRAPVQEFPLPDLSPPSPALSARSDTSNQSALARLRNFSLVGSRQANLPPNLAGSRQQDGTQDSDGKEGGYRSSHLRQMSSFERLSSTLGFMTTVNSLRRSASPESQLSDDYDSEDDDEATLSDGAYGRKRPRRERRRSMTSMPGSLMDEEEEMHFSDEEGENIYDADEADHDGDGDPVEEEFDDDILAAGEMSKVPFL